VGMMPTNEPNGATRDGPPTGGVFLDFGMGTAEEPRPWPDADTIVEAVVRRLIDPATSVGSGREDPASALPVIERGEVRIVPLAEIHDPLPGQDGPDDFPARASTLWMRTRSALEYRFGMPVGVDLQDGANPYLRELARTGVQVAHCWILDARALLLVAEGPPPPAPTNRLALHVVPSGWVSTRRPARRIPAVDLSWDWPDASGAAAPEDRRSGDRASG